MIHTIQVGLVVFVANAALLVLQLIAGRLLAPFIGVSLETWSAVIAAFLAGISLGNWFGGMLADRAATNRTLGSLLLIGAGLTAAMLLPLEVFRAVPLGPRIAAAAFALCLPVSFALSLITPVAIRALLPDITRTGRVVGLVYALGSLGSLAGNFLTGFVLLAYFTTTTIVLGCAVGLAALGVICFFVALGPPAPRVRIHGNEVPVARFEHPALTIRVRANEVPKARSPGLPTLSISAACAIVFVSSFCSMSLEIGASRLLAPVVGVSLYSWTGIIGVVLLGIVAGNYGGGRLADNLPTTATLGSCLFYSGLFTMLVLISFIVLQRWGGLEGLNMISQIIAWAAALFLAPMYLLATISPVVTRLAVGDVAHAGRIAGRIYAWSCLGAIAGTLATGWFLISLLQVKFLILVLSIVLVVLSIVVGRPWQRPAELFGGSIVLGSAVFGLYIQRSLVEPKGYYKETNYYTIRVYETSFGQDKVQALLLDRLDHSYAKPHDPTFLGYPHEQVQAEFARLSAERTGGAPRVLVIGGGGYTFPRWAEFSLPKSAIDVVEIDPGVTEAAHAEMGLKRDTRIVSYHMDGRQFVEERAAKGSYQLIVQDAVNDFSVPYHLMTKEYNDAVKALLDPDGVYLLTVIDEFEVGQLMRTAVRTLKESFAHVELLGASEIWKAQTRAGETGRQVWVIFASQKPFDVQAIQKAVRMQGADEAKTMAMPRDELNAYLAGGPPIVLTDKYAPVDNLISIVFRLRSKDPK